MLKVEYKVLVFVGGTTDVPSIFLESGVCTWDNSTGILAEEWWGVLSNSVDISLGGQYEVYSPTTIKMLSTSSVETTLANNGLTMAGKRVEIHEISTFGTTIIRRGIIGNDSVVGNSITIGVSHVVNKYNANLTPRIGDEYSYLVYGEDVDAIPLSVDLAKTGATIGEIGDKLYPAFTVMENSVSTVKLRCVYDFSNVSVSQLNTFLASSDFLLLEGEGNSLVGSAKSTSFVAVSGKFYTVFFATIMPLNHKEGDASLFLPVDSTVVVKFTEATKVYTPYGTTPAPDNIRYKKDGELFQFPSYIDSLQYFDDRIEILDSDDSGVVFVEPKSAHWSTVQELEEAFPIEVGFPKKYLEGFVFFYDQNTDITVHSGSTLDGDGIATRDGSNYASSEMGMTALAPEGVTGNINMSSCVTYVVENPLLHNNLYLTGDVEMSEIYHNGAPITGSTVHYYDYRVFVHAITITSQTYMPVEIENLASGWFPSGNGEKNYFPATVKNDVANENFRYDNEAHFDNYTGKVSLGYSTDLLEQFDFSPVDLRNPIKFIYQIDFHWRMPFSSNNTYSAKIPKMRLAIASKEGYSVDDLYIDGASNVDGITTVADSYVDVCSRQNLTSLGFDTPAKGWGLEIPTGDITEAVNTTDILANAPLIELIYSTNATGTKAVTYDLLRYGNGVGHIDSLGLESWADIGVMYTGGVEITPYDIAGIPTVKSIDTNKVYTDIGVATTDGNIEIKNTEQSVYDSSYVTGIDSTDDMKALWFSGNLLYQKFNVKNEYPKVLANCRGIVDVVPYIKRQYETNGVTSGIDAGEVFATMQKRFTLSFTVSTEFAIENFLWIGKGITPIFPSFGSGGTGIITGLSRSLKNGTVTISAEMVGETIATTTTHVIVESGTQTDSIIESGSQPDTYKETI